MSYLFDGVDDSATHNAGVVVATPFSFAVWIKTLTVKNAAIMSAMTSGSSAHNWTMEMIVTSGDLRAAATDSGENAAIHPGVIAVDGNWHHVVAVYTSSTSRSIYYDGVLGNPSSTSRTPATVNKFMLADRDGVNEFFHGYQAYPAIYGATALNQTNVTALFNGGAGLDPRNVTGCTSFYDTSSDQGGTLVNAVNPGTFDLAVSGAVWDADDPFSLTAPAVPLLPIFHPRLNTLLRL